MSLQKENIVVKKSYEFALKVVQLYKTLNERKEYILSKQVLRSGTSVGANIHEAVASDSKKDFVHKLGISLKEARETSYWLKLLRDGNFITNQEYSNLNVLCEELIKILNSIILTTKERYFPIIHNS